jgi:hypothetical protein
LGFQAGEGEQGGEQEAAHRARFSWPALGRKRRIAAEDEPVATGGYQRPKRRIADGVLREQRMLPDGWVRYLLTLSILT